MKTLLENDRIILCPEGRIDSNNALTVETEMLSELEAHPGLGVSIDAGKLEYISSAGLRVLMKLLGRTDEKLTVFNVAPEVYDIFEITGLSTLLEVKKRMREISVEGCELIGSGAYGRVYRLDRETIAKLYLPNISLDVVKCGDSYGVVYELLDARTMAQFIDRDPGCIPEIGRKSAELLKRLHQIVPGPNSGLPDRKEKMLDWVDSLSEFITPEESDSVKGFIRGIPDRNTFLHGDFNSKNIMVTQKDGCPDAEGSVSPDYDFQLIDIGDAAIGHPVFDLAMLMNVYINVPADMGGGLTEEGVRHLLGFDIKYARQLWDVMCAAYFGLSNPADIDKMTEKLYAYSRLLTTFHATTMAGNRDALQARVDRLLRGNLLPAIDRAQPLDF